MKKSNKNCSGVKTRFNISDLKQNLPLAPEQFLSLFFILMFGVFLAICLMGAEHAYIKWIRGHVAKTDKAGCCALISKVSLQKFKFCLKSRL